MADVKVIGGNNRQMDFLAFNPKTSEQYHVEVSVAASETWSPKQTSDLFPEFDKKYCGAPANRAGLRTDSGRGKNYREAINRTYEAKGLDPSKIERVWVCWTVVYPESMQRQLGDYCERHGLRSDGLKILRFRDDVIPALKDAVGTAFYEDDALRTFSLIRQTQVESTLNHHQSRQKPDLHINHTLTVQGTRNARSA